MPYERYSVNIRNTVSSKNLMEDLTVSVRNPFD